MDATGCSAHIRCASQKIGRKYSKRHQLCVQAEHDIQAFAVDVLGVMAENRTDCCFVFGLDWCALVDAADTQDSGDLY